MELQMMMDSGSETLNSGGSLWLGHSPSSSPQSHAPSSLPPPPPPPQPPPYHRLSPNRQDGRGIVSTQQVSMGFHESTSTGVLWHEKRDSPKHTSEEGSSLRNNGSTEISNRDESSNTKHSTNFHQSSTNGLKRRSSEVQSQITELERKHIRRDGSIGSNGCSHPGWSTQVEELAEHLAADFDGPLSALAASDLANAVASYNMSEALLALPSLTVFKQEVPSPENQVNNTNLNHTSHRRLNVSQHSNEADSNNNNTGQNNIISNINDGNATTTTANANSPTRTSIVSGGVNHHAHSNNNQGMRNNGQNATPSLHQLLYSSGEDYQQNSSGNHVSSSQQGNEFNEDSRFQYVLAAATSIATKLNEETLTYLNQGQSYEIKLKKLGDLSAYRGKILKSSIRICFHERRLQYTEREQMLAWQRARPGERLLQVDVPLSYGMVDVSQASPSKNSVEFMWDPTKEVGVYIKVNCISTEFTPKKHGGEKGVPFRILVETRFAGGSRLHAASCQVKVFKLKGADRKHKQDRDKILRRPPHEQDKYQPSYDCTVLSDIPLDSLSPQSPISQTEGNAFPSNDVATNQCRPTAIGSATGTSASPVVSTALSLTIGASPIGHFISALDPVKEEAGSNANNAVDTTANIGTTTVSRSTIETLPSSAVTGSIIPEQTSTDDINDTDSVANGELTVDANVTQTNAWLRARRFHSFQTTFASFSAGDILRLSRDDLIQICGLADGIRLFNALHSKAPTPKLTLYFAMEATGASPWRVIYLENLNSALLASKLLATLNLSHDRLHSVLIQGPQGVHVLVSNELVANIKDESMYLVEIIKDCASERYKLLLKPSSPR